MSDIFHIIHFLSVAMFLGSITHTLVWKIYADRTHNTQIVFHTLNTAIKVDKIITVPSALGVTLSGIALVATKIFLLAHLWLQISFVLWILSAIAAIFYLIPSLQRLEKIVDSKEDTPPRAYYVLAEQWNIASGILIVSPLIILILAITKPGH